MPDNEQLQLFEDQPIRTAWDKEKEEWYFSIVDVVGVLISQPDYNTARKYWNKVKQRLKDEGSRACCKIEKMARFLCNIVGAAYMRPGYLAMHRWFTGPDVSGPYE